MDDGVKMKKILIGMAFLMSMQTFATNCFEDTNFCEGSIAYYSHAGSPTIYKMKITKVTPDDPIYGSYVYGQKWLGTKWDEEEIVAHPKLYLSELNGFVPGFPEYQFNTPIENIGGDIDEVIACFESRCFLRDVKTKKTIYLYPDEILKRFTTRNFLINDTYQFSRWYTDNFGKTEIKKLFKREALGTSELSCQGVYEPLNTRLENIQVKIVDYYSNFAWNDFPLLFKGGQRRGFGTVKVTADCVLIN